MLRDLFKRYVLDQWHAIDAESVGVPTGPRSAAFKAIVTLVVSGMVLVFMQYIVLRGVLQQAVSSQLPELIGSLSADAGAFLRRYRAVLKNITWACGCAFFYMILPAIVVRLVFQERLRDWGLSPQGYFRHLWIYALMFIPVGAAVVAVSYTPAFQQGYPFYKTPYGIQDLLVWEAFYAMQFFCLEFFFRGFMLHGLKERYGTGAIMVMIIPYCMIHFQKPFLETTGAIVAGLVLGVLALRTRSIWGGATIHVAVAFTMDAAALWQKGGIQPPS